MDQHLGSPSPETTSWDLCPNLGIVTRDRKKSQGTQSEVAGGMFIPVYSREFLVPRRTLTPRTPFRETEGTGTQGSGYLDLRLDLIG